MDEGKHRIILNMSEVPYLDSAALGVLVDAVRRARENNGGLYLAQVMTFVRRAFEITRLIRIFPVYDTVEDAVAAATATGTAASGKS
jgi:anti-sigma B factor antagonist